MVGMPGCWPGFLALDRRTGGVSGGVGGRRGEEKYSCAVLMGRRNTVLQHGKLENIEENHVIQVPYY